MGVLVNFRSIWLLNLIETRFCLSRPQEIGEGEVGEQVVSKNHICDVPAGMEKGRDRSSGLCALF